MPDCYRILLVATHPVQYAVPIFRRMAQHPQMEIQVAYCSLQGAEPGIDREFGVEVKWDVPLLDGYPWVLVRNVSPRPGLGRFFGLINPGLWGLIAHGGHDAVIVYTGYRYLSFWIALVAAKVHHKPIIFGADAHSLAPRDGRSWKIAVKQRLWPWLFGLADVVIAPSTRTAELMRSLGIAEERLALVPYVVDNDWWSRQAKEVDRQQIRRAWGVPEHAPVVLFCAKLQPWKRPLDVLRAFVQAGIPGAHLVFAGEGRLRPQVESEARCSGVAERTHFLGFVNQSQLPAVYCASDLLVLPSDYEPFGVVVNEAMLCGCAVAVSERVGAGGDLVSAGVTGYIFPCGNIEALAALFRDLLSDRERLQRMGMAARQRMETWAPQDNVQTQLLAVETSLRLSI